MRVHAFVSSCLHGKVQFSFLPCVTLTRLKLFPALVQVVKMALALALFGGNQKSGEDKNKLSVRGDPHVLIVGEPGLGKSQMLQEICLPTTPEHSSLSKLSRVDTCRNIRCNSCSPFTMVVFQ